MDQRSGIQSEKLQEDEVLKQAREEVKGKLSEWCNTPEETNEVLNAAEAFCLLLLELD